MNDQFNQSTLPELSIHTTEDGTRYLLFNQSEVISDEVKKTGYWNPHVLDIATNILEKKTSGGLVIDVGAGFGSFTIPLAIDHPSFKFIAFEPLKVVFWQLCSNLLLNNLYNIRTHEKIVSNEVTNKLLYDIDYRSCNNHGSFSFNQKMNEIRGISSLEDSNIKMYGRHQYAITKIDDFGFTNVALFKISAAGMELEVLEGASETIERSSNAPIIVELWRESWYEREKSQCIDLLKSLGYSYIHDISSHVIATKTEEEFLVYNSSIKLEGEFGGFTIVDESNETEETLKNQTIS
jgi:FkbM family methyltransferase